MHAYTRRVRDNILPLSIANTLPKAFEEWRFTGKTIDHYHPTQTCKLCGKDEIRYHFEIENEFNQNCLMVGSHCILKFNLAVFVGGNRLTLDEAKKHLSKLTEQMRLASCIKALEQLATSENNDILRGALEYYRKNKKLTPKQAFVVFWRLNKNQIDHSPSFFNVTLKKQRYRDDLQAMPTSQVRFFWQALTVSQRNIATALGHTPPK